MESSDLSPSTVEFLEKEKFCLDEHKNTDDDFDCTISDVKHCTGTVSVHQEDQMTSSSSDDEIGSLIQKMKQLLSPRDLEYLRSNEGKDVEELLKETEEFIHKSSSLFHNSSVDSISSESYEEAITENEKLNEPFKPVDSLIKEMEDLARDTSSVVSQLILPETSVGDEKINENTSVTLNDIQVSTSSVDNKSEISEKETDHLQVLALAVDDETSGTDEEISNKNDSHVENTDKDGDGEVVNNKDSEGGSINDNSNTSIDNCNVNLQNINLTTEGDPNCNSLNIINENNNNYQNSDKNMNTTHPIINLNTEECNFTEEDLSTKCLSNSNLPKNDLALFTNDEQNIIHNINDEYNDSNGNYQRTRSPADLQQLKNSLEEMEVKHRSEVEILQTKYQEEILKLKECIRILNIKLAKYESQPNFTETGAGDSEKVAAITAEKKKIQELESEITKLEHLIAGYQRENQKLFANLTAYKELWKKEKLELEEKIRVGLKLDNKYTALQDELKDAQEAIVRYQLELVNYKELWKQEKIELEEKVRVASSLDNKNLFLQNQLKDAQETNVKFQLELENYKMEKMSDTLMKWQADHDQLTAESSDLNMEIDSLKINVTQLQAALNVERTQKKNLSRDKDLLLRENMDLKRQVREVEGIIKRRSQSDSTITKVVGEGRLKDLEKELQARQVALSSMQTQLEDMQIKYNDHIIELEQRLKFSQEENCVLRQQLNNATQRDDVTSEAVQSTKRTLPSSNSATQLPASGCSQGSRVATGGSNKEDAHLLATIRGMKLELTKKDKELMKLNKDLEDARKTNRRLQREREKQLKTGAPQKSSSMQSSNLIKIDNKGRSVSASAEMTYERSYNQAMFEEEREEETALLKMENKSLREELKRLGQDIVTLHTKRIQDLRTLQTEHEQEIQRLINDYSNRHSQSSVAELQGQIYTHQMVITHLKEQLKQLTELKEENAMLKLERDHLEKALMGANKRIQELQTPESQQYQSLLEKFENLEQRHEVREQKLQAIVRDLLARSSESVTCGPVCRSKLLDKNREICYYRVEMDRILEALREFRRSK